MDGSLGNRERPSIVRITFEFYPIRGGSVTHLIELIKMINQHLKDQIIIAPDFGISNDLHDENFEVPVIRINYPKWLEKFSNLHIPTVPLTLWLYANNISKWIKKNNDHFELIYVHGTLLGAILSVLLRIKGVNTPLIIVQESANLFNINKKSALAAHLAFFLFHFHKPDCLLIIDDGMGIEEYQSHLNKNRIPFKNAYAAIDTDFFIPNNNLKSKELFIVLSTQRLDAFKRVDLGILAFKSFLKKMDYKNNIKLIIVGDGPERLALEELTAKEGLNKWVEFHGQKNIKDVVKYLQTADVVIGTSMKSNLNLSIQEAMSCEKPVIAFSSGFAISKLIVNLKNGILVSPGNIDEFADGLELLYKNQELRDIVGKFARLTIVNERNWSIRIEKEFEIWSDIL